MRSASFSSGREVTDTTCHQYADHRRDCEILRVNWLPKTEVVEGQKKQNRTGGVGEFLTNFIICSIIGLVAL